MQFFGYFSLGTPNAFTLRNSMENAASFLQKLCRPAADRMSARIEKDYQDRWAAQDERIASEGNEVLEREKRRQSGY